jgi:hypothetical protein
MITIDKNNPWILWPESICQHFITKSALDLFDNGEYWKMEIGFSYPNNNISRYDLFAVIPNFTGISIIDGFIYIGNEYSEFSDFINTNIKIESGNENKLVLEHTPNDKMIIYMNGSLVYVIDLEKTPLRQKVKSKLLLGSSDWNYKEKNETDNYTIDFFELKISSKDEMITHHNFNNIVHDKSIDLTENFNIFYKMN